MGQENSEASFLPIPFDKIYRDFSLELLFLYMTPWGVFLRGEENREGTPICHCPQLLHFHAQVSLKRSKFYTFFSCDKLVPENSSLNIHPKVK